MGQDDDGGQPAGQLADDVAQAAGHRLEAPAGQKLTSFAATARDATVPAGRGPASTCIFVIAYAYFPSNGAPGCGSGRPRRRDRDERERERSSDQTLHADVGQHTVRPEPSREGERDERDIVGLVDVRDPEQYAEYVKHTPREIARHGGRFVVRGGERIVLEGEDDGRRLVVIEFPSLEAAQAFYESPEYQAVKRLREGASEAQLVAIERYPDEEWQAVRAASEALPAANLKRADARTRTGDPIITSDVLYQLSYVGGAWLRHRPV